jgi:hypothetical protein
MRHRRPTQFSISTQHPLSRDLTFAMLGQHPESRRVHDSSLYHNHGIIDPTSLAGNWRYSEHLSRWVLSDYPTDGVIFLDPVPSVSVRGTSQFSIVLWMRNTNYHANSIQAIWTEYRGDAEQSVRISYRFYTVSASRRLGFRGAADNGTFETYVEVPVTQLPPINEWWVGTIVYDAIAGSCILYANGHFLAEGAATITFTNTQSLQDIHIGNLVARNRAIEGDIGDVMFYRRALAAAEVRQLADPSNVMLSGLIKTPSRRLWVVPSDIVGPVTHDVSGESFCWAVPSGAITASRVVEGNSFAWAVPEGAITAKRVVSGEAYLWAVANGDVTVVDGPVTHPVEGQAFAWAVPQGDITASRVVAGDAFVWAVASGDVNLRAVVDGESFVWATPAGLITAQLQVEGESFVWAVGAELSPPIRLRRRIALVGEQAIRSLVGEQAIRNLKGEL